MGNSRLTALTDRVYRLDFGGLHVDLVATSRGTVRIGSMPDIAKFLVEHGFREEIVVVPDWWVSLAGDNRTGEEFVLWQSQVRGGLVREYVGRGHNVTQVHHHLNRIFPYFFDERRLKIVRKRWLDNWFHPSCAEPCFQMGSLEILFEGDSVILRDGGRRIYHGAEFAATASPDAGIEDLLATLPRDRAIRDCLEIIPIGCGNGFHGTAASTLVRFGADALWIDPSGYPAHTLARHSVHWDDISHVLFTHNHEDHVQGFTACLERARRRRCRLNLLVAKSVLRLLVELYTPLFPDLLEHVNVLPLEPGAPLQLGGMTIECRWNHHILPYGTLGLRISAGGRCFGYSGDTKYDEAINAILQREELTAAWFAPCDLVFHEVEFDNPNSVHSHWKHVQALQRAISGRVLGYHTEYLANSPFPLAKEGCRYLLDGKSCL